jgi:hypothetical protein
MPAKGTRKREPRERLVKTRLTQHEADALAVLARTCHMTQAGYVRGLIASELVAVLHRPKPRKRAALERDALAREVNQLGMQIRKLGVNVNQLARQANTSLVPLERGEVVYVLNQLQLLTSETRATLERVLA